MTFVPFVYNHLEDFKVMNPFKIQSSSLMPLKYCLACIALFIFGTILIAKEKNDVYFFSGLILFLTIIVYYVYLIKEYDFENAFFNSQAHLFILFSSLHNLSFIDYIVENENKIVKIEI